MSAPTFSDILSNDCPYCHQSGRKCWATRCGEDDLETSFEDAEAYIGDMQAKEEREAV